MKTDYDSQAHLWARDSPETFSDHVARECVREILGDFNPASVLDIGCGEGYFARQIARPGCRIVGIDLSAEMIRFAKEKEKENPLGIEYLVGNALDLPEELVDFDICIGNFVTHYFSPKDGGLFSFYKNISGALTDQGCFILSFSHPCFQLLEHQTTAIFEKQGYDYIESRGRHFPGYLPTINGKVLRIGYVHSTLEDHFNAIREAGLVVTDVREPVVSEEIAEKHELFREKKGKVGFMILAGRKL